jgi:DNA-binding CsgD family transcriptional regulator/DNA-binding transcriptional ArsR family regulator
VLEVLGVDRWGEAAYLALIDGPSLTVDELIERTGIDPPDLTRVLTGLTERGLIYRADEQPERFAALPPDNAVEVLLMARERDLNQVRALARHLNQRHQQARSGRRATELIEVIVGADGVALCGEQLLRGARREIRGIDAPPYSQHSDGVPVGSISTGLGRGVRSRFIHDRATLWLPGRAQKIEQEMAAGEQARVLVDVPMKMIIADDALAVVPLQSTPQVLDACILVRPSPLLDALITLFETLWERAQPFIAAQTLAEIESADPGKGPVAGSELTGEQRQIISLLALGLSDEAISRQLGLGLRTVQRRIQSLMTELGAFSRFQAGVLAAQHGWWNPPVSGPGSSPPA